MSKNNRDRGRNGKCKCNSGLKFKHCHGDARKMAVCQEVQDGRFASLVWDERVRQDRDAAAYNALPWYKRTFITIGRKLSTSVPCTCGSGVEYSKCHGDPEKKVRSKNAANMRMLELIEEEKAKRNYVKT